MRRTKEKRREEKRGKEKKREEKIGEERRRERVSSVCLHPGVSGHSKPCRSQYTCIVAKSTPHL